MIVCSTRYARRKSTPVIPVLAVNEKISGFDYALNSEPL
jgi:hypothetical protein